MDDEKLKEKNPLGFKSLWGISIFVSCVFSVLNEVIRWTDHLAGLMNGLIHCFLIAIGGSLYFVPWILLVFGLYRWRKWNRYRSVWSLVPMGYFVISLIVNLVINPPLPQYRFKRLVKVEFPENAQDVQYSFSGGGLADYYDVYYFKTTPDEIDRLISEMGLLKSKKSSLESFQLEPQGFPDPRGWTGVSIYRGSDEQQIWFYKLWVNEEETEVYITVCCI